MGVILDSSVLIAAERQGSNARQMLAAFFPDREFSRERGLELDGWRTKN